MIMDICNITGFELQRMYQNYLGDLQTSICRYIKCLSKVPRLARVLPESTLTPR